MSGNRIEDVGFSSRDVRSPKMLNVNRYATKKTIAQGMLDIALLTANASQLRYVLQTGDAHEFYSLMVALISLSIALQVLVGVLMLIVGALDVNKDTHKLPADIINDITVIIIFLISLVNVLIASFGIEDTNRLYGGGDSSSVASLRTQPAT